MKLKNGKDVAWQNVTLGDIYTELDWHHPETTDKDRNLYNWLKIWLDGHRGYDMERSLYHMINYYKKIYKEMKDIKNEMDNN